MAEKLKLIAPNDVYIPATHKLIFPTNYNKVVSAKCTYEEKVKNLILTINKEIEIFKPYLFNIESIKDRYYDHCVSALKDKFYMFHTIYAKAVKRCNFIINSIYAQMGPVLIT